MKIITVANRKGGTGKTTTAYNLAFSLALKNKLVCLVDLDSQGNLSLISKVDSISLEEFKNCEIKKINDKINILPFTKDFPILENEINSLLDRNNYLRDNIITKIDDARTYDYVIIDTSPGMNILNINAFFASDEAAIIVNSDYFSLSGLRQLIGVINQVQSMNTKLDYKIILNNFIKGRKYFDSLEPVLKSFEKYTDIKIPSRQAFIENSSLSKPTIDLEDVYTEYEKMCAVLS